MIDSGKKKIKPKMVNITINLPTIYDENIQKLIKLKVVPSRSEAIRIALREYLYNEEENLKLLGFSDESSK
jgi:Arc/MetJ-type ribon-helix-helix transcriptional regulator